MQQTREHAKSYPEVHTIDDLKRSETHFGHLIWRLEEASTDESENIEHSDEAVQPDTGFEWP